MDRALDKLRDPDLAARLADRVRGMAARAAERLGRPVVIMEICGTHTTAISRTGLRGLVAGSLILLSGPGCPVCVTGAADIERMISLARIPGVSVATFGDMIRVPGVHSSLEEERARGADVRLIYSPADAVRLAEVLSEREVVFLGAGFETTAPLTALALAAAVDRRLKNFSVYSVHKLVPPALRALLAGGEIAVDGLLLPGHVCSITGRAAFDFVAVDYGIPAVVAGFEPLDILGSWYLLLEMILAGRPAVVNGYTRVVSEDGNPKARQALFGQFTIDEALWRGLGSIPGSGLFLKRAVADFDARRRFPFPDPPAGEKPGGCRCGDLLKGKITPRECPLYAGPCTPARPAGPCMVSSEGACAAYYHYERAGNY
ncbi:MAG: hydrogenase formation protein HypD [Firmicutes bacterium]|nr:hydrogenase formation protein HypD [Bacillota bacterium]